MCLAGAAAALLALSACAPPNAATPGDGDGVRVVATTGILADLARNVAGDRATVAAVVPDGADPHSYEPTLRNVRDIVYADVAFSNYLLLEQQSIVRSLTANLRDGVPHIALAENATQYAAEMIPLVEDVSLDTVWLGARVAGDGAEFGAGRTSEVLVSATGMTGPGDMHTYLTGTFGEVTRYIDSTDGFDAATGYRDDTISLPPDAHTHLSWAFTAPGIYEVDMRAALHTEPGARPLDIARDTLTFAVGVDPHDVPGPAGATVLDSGHADLTVDLNAGALRLLVDAERGDHDTGRTFLDPGDVVISVPTKALHEVPGDPSFRFLGRAGEPVYQLPQAVLGKHVHGEIDPHLWHDVRNAMAYVQVIRDALIAVDPEGAGEYVDNTRRYLDELAVLDADVAATIETIPPSRRVLVTTHDAFGYLAAAYDMTVAGFVTPNPAVEPSLAERKRLTQTIEDLRVPAVFLEPTLAARSSTLTEVATEAGIEVCPIRGDTLDEVAPTYVDLMRRNAHSLAHCLTGGAADDIR